jgi:hypothetical protein
MNPQSTSVALLLSSGLFFGCTAPATHVSRPVAPASTPEPGPRAVVIVKVQMPWYAPRAMVRGKFRDALPEYEAIAPLEAKYFTITDDRRYGGIYLWKGRADAERHFDAAWHARVREKRGVEGDVTILDAPFVLDGPALPVGEPRGTRALEAPSWASFVRLDLPATADLATATHALASGPFADEALIRAFVVRGAGFVGVVSLWATRAAADAAVSIDRRTSLGARVGASRSEGEVFEAPLLIDATLRQPAGQGARGGAKESPR